MILQPGQNTDAVLADYRAKRAALIAAGDKADAAFNRAFAKAQAGMPCSFAAASRLSNLANYASADYASAQSAVWAIGIDSQAIDRADGIDPFPVV